MKVLLIAGLLYLSGIAAILVLRPTLMFTEDGAWKEFGIGRDPRYYTWMPFWLVAILWAMLSYLLVQIIVGDDIGASGASIPVVPAEEAPKAKSKQSLAKPGYYLLDAEATARNGVPKYVYLGEEAPNLVFNSGAGDKHAD